MARGRVQGQRATALGVPAVTRMPAAGELEERWAGGMCVCVCDPGSRNDSSIYLTSRVDPRNGGGIMCV